MDRAFHDTGKNFILTRQEHRTHEAGHRYLSVPRGSIVPSRSGEQQLPRRRDAPAADWKLSRSFLPPARRMTGRVRGRMTMPCDLRRTSAYSVPSSSSSSTLSTSVSCSFKTQGRRSQRGTSRQYGVLCTPYRVRDRTLIPAVRLRRLYRVRSTACLSSVCRR